MHKYFEARENMWSHAQNMIEHKKMCGKRTKIS